MQIVTTSDIRKQLTTLITKLSKGKGKKFLLTKYGRPIAEISSIGLTK